jgi:molybdopterin molybdotransferase
MISVKEAKERLFKAVKELPAENVLIAEASGRVLCQDIFAKIDMPPFSQSAVDGFVIIADDHSKLGTGLIHVVGEIKAGDAPLRHVKKNSAYRIYTGAPIPRGALGVIMQEKAEHFENDIKVPISQDYLNLNIRKQASHFSKKTRLLSKGTKLNVAAIGVLASQGYNKVKVFKQPVVSVIVTGNELVSPGKKLKPGKIYQSNSFTINAALCDNGFKTFKSLTVGDNLVVTQKKIQLLLNQSDVLIITGGISVGKYDLVQKALNNLGVQELFYKVNQKPGKPIFAGKINSKIIFALPGNPAAVIVCFYQYVLPALMKMAGLDHAKNRVSMLPLKHSFLVKGDRDVFVRSSINNGEVVINSSQDSDNLFSFASSSALVYLPARSSVYSAGELVETHFLWEN